MDHHSEKSLAALTTEIALKATAKVCHGFTPWRIEAIAAPLAEALVDIVISQGNTAYKHAPIIVHHYRTFEIWNAILDEVEKEIPCVSKLEVIAKEVTREQRAQFLEGSWRNNGKSNDDPSLH